MRFNSNHVYWFGRPASEHYTSIQPPSSGLTRPIYNFHPPTTHIYPNHGQTLQLAKTAARLVPVASVTTSAGDGRSAVYLTGRANVRRPPPPQRSYLPPPPALRGPPYHQQQEHRLVYNDRFVSLSLPELATLPTAVVTTDQDNFYTETTTLPSQEVFTTTALGKDNDESGETGEEFKDTVDHTEVYDATTQAPRSAKQFVEDEISKSTLESIGTTTTATSSTATTHQTTTTDIATTPLFDDDNTTDEVKIIFSAYHPYLPFLFASRSAK